MTASLSPHWNPIVALAFATQHRGAELIAAGAKMMTARYGGILFNMALDDLRRAHAKVGEALAAYDRATTFIAIADRKAVVDQPARFAAE